MIRALVLTALLGGCLGKPEPPELGSLPSKFAVGDNHACTIDDKTQLGCWGRNAEGELGRSDAALFAAPVQVGTDSGWTAVAAGRQHTCGINRGHARCWGDNGVTQSDGGTFDKDLDLGGFVPTRIFAANYGTCVLDASGRVMCWGEPAIDGTAPVAIDPGGKGLAFQQLALGGDHACALAVDGTAYCWGGNSNGQLGTASSTTIVTPAQAQPHTGPYRAIAVGDRSTCGITADRAIECWGNANSPLFGAAFDPNNGESTGAIVDATHRWDSISMSTQSVCGTTGGDVYCYGQGDAGQLGDGFTPHVLASTPVVTNAIGVQVGDDFACARTVAGAISCWGQNRFGNIGNGKVARTAIPVDVAIPVQGSEEIVSVYAGARHACAQTSTGALWCWGDNRAHQVDPSVQEAFVTLPHQVTSLDGIPLALTDISLGRDHTCGIAMTGEAHCWGSNDFLQNGGDSKSMTSATINGPWNSIAAGSYATCAIGADHNIYCWGHVPGGADQTPPATATRTGNYLQVAVGDEHVVATDGSGVTAWGRKCAATGIGLTGEAAEVIGPNDQGVNVALGVATTPTAIDITAAGQNAGADTCALIQTQGGVELRCWGENQSNELNDHTDRLCVPPTVRTTIPLFQPSGDGQLAIAGYHGCAISMNNDLVCWGDNQDGQLGARKQVPNSMVDAGGLDVAGKYSWVSLSSTFGCGVTAATTSVVKCWGTSAYGELGSGVRFVDTPFQVPIP